MQSPESWTIRDATADDYHGVCDLFDEVDRLHREAHPLVFRPPEGPARSMEFVAEILADENAALFVAECAGDLGGLGHVYIHAESPSLPILIPRRYGILDALVVHERFRRRGIARALLQRAEQWVVEKRADQMQIGVWEFNRAPSSLYQKLGYSTVYRKLSKRLEAED